MLQAAEAQLQASPARDISTRAVCDAVGVGAPVLYRLFGDKNGLLAAVVDRAFERYLTSKRTQKLSDDPVNDLYSAWDAHIAFALKNQAVYRIAYAPGLSDVPAGVDEARRLLVERLVRCAQAGRLNTAPDEAAQIMMAASTGVALSLITQPATFSDRGLAQRVRDAVVGDFLVDAAPATDHNVGSLKSVALQMSALLRTAPTPLTNPEVLLMLQWLDAIAAGQTAGARSTKKAATPSRARRRR
jgi:AcrR family transcriptional regulator